MTFVHAEPYVMRDVGGRIQPELDGPNVQVRVLERGLRDPRRAVRLRRRRDGTIVASFELIVGSDEIRTAIRAALGE